jgi:hypothetical protein
MRTQRHHKTMTASARAATSPARTSAPSSSPREPQISRTAADRIAQVDAAELAGDLTPAEAESRRQGYRYFGEREAAGLPPVDLTY